MSAERADVATILALAASVDTAYKQAALRAASDCLWADERLRMAFKHGGAEEQDDAVREVRARLRECGTDIYRLTEGADR